MPQNSEKFIFTFFFRKFGMGCILWALSIRTRQWLHRFSASPDAFFMVHDSLFNWHRSRHVDSLVKVYDHGEHR
ncbi:MAG: hypothetical protein M1415_07240, partial [Firmicutes bacterium]|nr:hypothetical protein [Bacillota bacterium]